MQTTALVRSLRSAFGEAILISEMPALQNVARDANFSLLGSFGEREDRAIIHDFIDGACEKG